MASWINITPNVQKGLEIIPNLDNNKFRLLVNHICQGLSTDIKGKIFTADEEQKLMVSLNLEKETLNLLIDTITFVYTQAAFATVKAAVMQDTMKVSFPISEENISIFVTAWVTYGKRIIDSSRQKSIFPNQLKDIHWSFNIQASSPATALDSTPVAQLQLELTGEEEKRLTVELDKTSLTELFNNLEKIQGQLDSFK